MTTLSRSQVAALHRMGRRQVRLDRVESALRRTLRVMLFTATAVWIAVAVVLGLTLLLSVLHSDAQADRMKVRGAVTHMGYTSGLPGGVRYAATHYGKRKGTWTFKHGSRLRVEHRKRHIIVRVVDTCAGDACKMLDLSLAGFSRLFGSGSQGVGRVTVRCGRGGHKPMRRCLVGEDK
jgi:hypothetical protein